MTTPYGMREAISAMVFHSLYLLCIFQGMFSGVLRENSNISKIKPAIFTNLRA